MSITITGSTGITLPDASVVTSGKQACKAWVNFNGTGTVAIRDQFNVSSITDDGTGVYRVNMTSALNNSNYSAVASANDTGGYGAVVRTNDSGVSPTNTVFRLSITGPQASSFYDAAYISVAVFGS